MNSLEVAFKEHFLMRDEAVKVLEMPERHPRNDDQDESRQVEVGA